MLLFQTVNLFVLEVIMGQSSGQQTLSDKWDPHRNPSVTFKVPPAPSEETSRTPGLTDGYLGFSRDFMENNMRFGAPSVPKFSKGRSLLPHWLGFLTLSP